MIDSIKPVTTAPLPCKICGNAAPLFGVVDFNKCCREASGYRLPLSGLPVYYRRCEACGFLFTDAFDDWTIAEFKAHIYNDDYDTVDPDYQTVRPTANAATVIELWKAAKANTHVLDYGGGNDVFCAALRANGFATAVTYDPMTPEYAAWPEGKFELVTCFETLEHLPDPLATIGAIAQCTAEPGFILYSTLLQRSWLQQHGLNWWYVGPRNGHISIFTQKALATAWGRYRYRTMSLSDDLHAAFRTLPGFINLVPAAASPAAPADEGPPASA